MPTNLYRFQGPEGTIPYQHYLIDKNNTKLTKIATALMKNERCDGRDISAHRNLCNIKVFSIL
jgi:exosome complex RNA-binding protein Rrp42 (RNase PH superfamily)